MLNVYLYMVIPKGFFPQQDTGQLQGGMRGDATSSFQLMKSKLQEVAEIIQSDPAVAAVDRHPWAAAASGRSAAAAERQR